LQQAQWPQQHSQQGQQQAASPSAAMMTPGEKKRTGRPIATPPTSKGPPKVPFKGV
jgi:hypothetical protein